MTSVFLLGATGYIGGSLLVVLKKAHPDLKITALVRSPAHLERVRAAGATPVQGTFGDVDLIATLSAQSDIVINTADCDDVSLTTAILRGIKQRSLEGRGKGTLIHSSGAGVFLNDTGTGTFDPNGKVWNDNVEEDIKAITTNMPHGQVDVPILKAGEEGYVNTYIICPSAVYGRATGPVGKHSIYYKILVDLALTLKYVPLVGAGSNVVATVHIDDIVALFARVFDRALAGPPTGSPYSRYFIGTSGETTAKAIASDVAQALHAAGRIDSPVPRSASIGDLGVAAPYVAANMIVRPERSLALGWVPKGPPFEDLFEDDLKLFLADL